MTLEFTYDAIDRLAGIAVDLNASGENIVCPAPCSDGDGARARRPSPSTPPPTQGGERLTIDAEFVTTAMSETWPRNHGSVAVYPVGPVKAR